MPPSSLRSQAGGLPSGPRSRSVGPTSRQQNARRSDVDRRDSDTVPPSSSSRQVRPQRSMASFPREPSRSRAPPPAPESMRTMRHTPQPQSYDNRPQSTRSRASEESTASSSVSSIFDRVRNGAASYASSFTSVEDNSNDSGYDERPGRSLRKQRPVTSEPPSPQDRYEPERTDTGTGDGYTVWSRVATAASSLTINVGKAWAMNVTTFAGEETPPGQESRLTRAMKAYHIEKARDPTDLPAWLFEEHERQPRQPRRRTTREQTDADMYEMIPAQVPPPPRRIRAFAQSPSLNQPPSQSTETGDIRQAPKGTDRLKALREARRAANNPTPTREDPVAFDNHSRRGPRVGLPSGPAVRTRRN